MNIADLPLYKSKFMIKCGILLLGIQENSPRYLLIFWPICNKICSGPGTGPLHRQYLSISLVNEHFVYKSYLKNSNVELPFLPNFLSKADLFLFSILQVLPMLLSLDYLGQAIAFLRDRKGSHLQGILLKDFLQPAICRLIT